MYVPDIPGISTSIIDRSTMEKNIKGLRTILLPGFFKYGKEDFVEFNDFDSFKYSLGDVDIKKYGNGYLYGEAASSTDNVIAYRLLPSDATYSNNTVRANGEFKSYKEIYSKTDMNYLGAESKVNDDIVISALATARGMGYNNIFISFSPATEAEKMDSNYEGETNYKFNFMKAEIFEESVTGIKSLGDPVVFSLIDVDQVTNIAITDKISGNELFVNSIFKDANEFATLNVNPTFSGEISEKATIDDLVNERLIIEDNDIEGKYYEVKVETYIKVVKNPVTLKNERITDTRLAATISLDRAPTLNILRFVDDAGDVHYKQIQISDSVISFVTVESPIDSAASFNIDGTDAFYSIHIPDGDPSEVLPVWSEIYVLRHQIYNKLLSYSMRLYSGTDGENLHINNTLNMNGFSEVGKENAKELLMDFYNNTPKLREVLYPKHDFDYIPDWSENKDVIVSIINLADDIGISMPIVALPLDYNPTIVTKDLVDKDMLMRKNVLYQSSYNSALYSGQLNKTFRTKTNKRLYMPLSYDAMVAHLRIDSQYSITEPVANIIKGTLASTSVNLTYEPISLEIEELRYAQINSVIVEPDGTYIIDQLSMYRKASKLSRLNLVKVIHRLRKDLPKLLKDLLQNKAIGSIISIAENRTKNELNKYVTTPDNDKHGIFETASVNASFNKSTNKLRLNIKVNPIGTIESIDIPIIVI